MRKRERPPKGDWDLKLSPGGELENGRAQCAGFDNRAHGLSTLESGDDYRRASWGRPVAIYPRCKIARPNQRLAILRSVIRDPLLRVDFFLLLLRGFDDLLRYVLWHFFVAVQFPLVEGSPLRERAHVLDDLEARDPLLGEAHLDDAPALDQAPVRQSDLRSDGDDALRILGDGARRQSAVQLPGAIGPGRC